MSIILLVTVTVLYAGYNLLVKVSSDHVPEQASTTVLATICLQLFALATSTIFAALLYSGGGQTFALSPRVYLWAAAAGICIGGAEIGYFYLFSGLGHGTPMPAGTAIPIVVSGSIVLALLVSVPVFRESLSWLQLAGALLVIIGINLLFFGRAGQGA